MFVEFFLPLKKDTRERKIRTIKPRVGKIRYV
jgi:hypothetical protein